MTLDNKIKSDKKTDSFVLQYCTVHNFGAVSKDSHRQKQHISESEEKCKFVNYNPKKHNPEYNESKIINSHVEDDEEKISDTQKVLNFAENNILKKVRSFENHSNVYGIIKINNNNKVLLLNSKECTQWLKSTYYDDSGKVHSNDLYKNALEIIIAQAITNETKIEKIYTRIGFVNDEIFYNLCNSDYELVKITKDGYSITKSGLDTPMFRRKSSPMPQPKPKKIKNKNGLDELVNLLKIPQENKQLFKIHLISFFIENCSIPMMILHGEAGSSKSTVTATVKEIVDPSPENRNSMPESIDDLNIHIFNRYISNFDNLSHITQKTSDELCKIITGHAHNKRELYSDDGEVILTIKGRVLLNGITPNVEYTDLMERSIFYESKYLPKPQRIEDSKFNNLVSKIKPYLLDQVFNSLSYTLENYKTISKEIKEKERMAEFTVFGESISRSLGYEKLSFIESYKNNLNSNSLRAYESWPIINIVLDIIKSKGKDFEVSIDELFKQCRSIAYEKISDIKSQFTRFPKNEAGLSAQLTRLSGSFRSAGYDITSYRYNSRDGQFKRGTRIIKITSTGTSFLSSFEKSKPPVSPVSVCQDDIQARKEPKTDTGKKFKPVSPVSGKNKSKTDTNDDTNKKSKPVSKNDKSTPKNGTDTVTQLTQPLSESLDGEEKKKRAVTKKNRKSKDDKSEKHTHFKCLTCNAGEFGINDKGTNSESILNFHKKLGHSIQYLNQKED